jgi:hypothetical protein
MFRNRNSALFAVFFLLAEFGTQQTMGIKMGQLKKVGKLLWKNKDEVKTVVKVGCSIS